MSFCEKLKECRAAAGLSQDDVAKKVGITQAAYSYIEKGLKMPSLPVATSLAKALNTSLDYLTDNNQ